MSSTIMPAGTASNSGTTVTGRAARRAARKASKTTKSPHGGRHGSNVAAHIILSIASVAMLFPFAWQIIMALSTNQQIMSVPPTFWPGTLQWHNFADVFSRLPFLSELRVSILITVIRTVGQVVLCSLAGYAFARMHFRFKKTLFAILLSILMVPSQVYLIPQYQLIQKFGLLESVAGIVLPGLFSAFGVFLMRQYFVSLPDELEEAARLDGAGPVRIFFKIMLPLAKPGISALTIMTVLWSWNDLLWPLVVTTQAQNMPLSVGLATLQGQHTVDYAVLMAASLLAMAPVLIMFLLMQRRVIDGLAQSGLKG